MTDSGNNQPLDPSFEHLEAQVADITMQDEAYRDHQVRHAAQDIKRALFAVIPDIMAGYYGSHEPTEIDISALPMGTDHRPIVRNHQEAMALAETNPELAADVKRVADSYTIVPFQQLQVDMKKAQHAGNTDALNELGVKFLKLDQERERIEFFAAVASLHPITSDYRKVEIGVIDNTTYEHSPTTTVEDRVFLIRNLDKSYQRLRDYLDKNSPGMIRASYAHAAAHPEDTGYLRAVEELERRVRDKVVQHDKVGKVLSDIMTGRAAVYDDPRITPEKQPSSSGPTPASTEKTAVATYYQHLKNLPGYDFVNEIRAGRYDDLPQGGWLIETRIHPGESGSIVLKRILDGGYKLSDYVGPTGNDQSAYLDLHFDSSKMAKAKVLYGRFSESSRANGMDASESAYPNATELADGKFLLSTDKPMRIVEGKGYDYFCQSQWTNLDHGYERWSSYSTEVVGRLTDRPEEAMEIVRQMGLAMGMSKDEAEVLVHTFVSKDAFTEPKLKSLAEVRKELEPQDTLIAEYDNGSKVVERSGGEVWVVESDGSEWCQRSASGLCYSGPDDLAGYYSE